MPLSADTLLDRLYLKSQITRWRLLAIVSVVLAVFVIAESRTEGASPIEREYIARLTIEGVMLDDVERDKLLENLRDNGKVKAVLVRLDTPGGSAVAGEETFRRLREIAEKKPVVAVMRDVAASAGYMTALSADRIFAREGTLTGSIGVIIQSAEFTELAEKIGVTPITVKTGPLKDALSPYTPVSEEAKDAMQLVVNDFFQSFINMVTERRKLPREEVLKLADGRVFTGNQALKFKLIDQLGGEQDAVNWLIKEKKLSDSIQVKDVEVKDNQPAWLEKIAGTYMQKILPGASGTLDGLVAIWHPNLQLQ